MRLVKVGSKMFTRVEFLVLSAASVASAIVLLLCSIAGSGVRVPAWAQFDYRAANWALDRVIDREMKRD